MRIEFVKDWFGHKPGEVLDCRDGAVLTSGQADMLVLRGIARPAPIEVPGSDPAIDLPKAVRRRK